MKRKKTKRPLGRLRTRQGLIKVFYNPRTKRTYKMKKGKIIGVVGGTKKQRRKLKRK